MNWMRVQTEVRNFVCSPYFIEVGQRLGLACILCTVLFGAVAVGPNLLRLCYIYIANALFPLIGTGVILGMLFTLLLTSLIDKDGRDRLRTWATGVCVRIVGWIMKKLLGSLFYAIVFTLRVTLALFCPGKIADHVQSAMGLFSEQIRNMTGLKNT